MEHVLPFIVVVLLIGVILCIIGWKILDNKGYSTNYKAIWLLIAICTDGVLSFIIALLLPDKTNEQKQMQNSWVCMHCGRINPLNTNYCASCNNPRAGYKE